MRVSIKNILNVENGSFFDLLFHYKLMNNILPFERFLINKAKVKMGSGNLLINTLSFYPQLGDTPIRSVRALVDLLDTHKIDHNLVYVIVKDDANNAWVPVRAMLFCDNVEKKIQIIYDDPCHEWDARTIVDFHGIMRVDVAPMTLNPFAKSANCSESLPYVFTSYAEAVSYAELLSQTSQINAEIREKLDKRARIAAAIKHLEEDIVTI